MHATCGQIKVMSALLSPSQKGVYVEAKLLLNVAIYLTSSVMTAPRRCRCGIHSVCIGDAGLNCRASVFIDAPQSVLKVCYSIG